ncbi:MAG: Mur ligase domain-containing protein [Pseudomonadota bacterium]
MILRDLFPQLTGPEGETAVTGLTADSRQIAPGFVFAAMQGVVTDGRKFIGAAIETGAVAVMGEALPKIEGAVAIEVSNARLALAEASARFYPEQPAELVAVTGTNGKSSTVDFLRQIWESAGLKAASLGTLGAIGPSGKIDLGHTTPDPVAIHATLQKLVRAKIKGMHGHSGAAIFIDIYRTIHALFGALPVFVLSFHVVINSLLSFQYSSTLPFQK